VESDVYMWAGVTYHRFPYGLHPYPQSWWVYTFPFGWLVYSSPPP